MIAEVNLYVQFNITNNHCLTSIDLEYWKMPSRRFYVVKKDEYEDMLRSHRNAQGYGSWNVYIMHVHGSMPRMIKTH